MFFRATSNAMRGADPLRSRGLSLGVKTRSSQRLNALYAERGCAALFPACRALLPGLSGRGALQPRQGLSARRRGSGRLPLRGRDVKLDGAQISPGALSLGGSMGSVDDWPLATVTANILGGSAVTGSRRGRLRPNVIGARWPPPGGASCRSPAPPLTRPNGGVADGPLGNSVGATGWPARGAILHRGVAPRVGWRPLAVPSLPVIDYFYPPLGDPGGGLGPPGGGPPARGLGG